jgi:hypothetical protein
MNCSNNILNSRLELFGWQVQGRETRLNSLRLKLGRDLTEDLRKEGSGLKEWFLRDFERQMILTEAFASRQDPVETVYHRALAEMINRTINDLESMIDQGKVCKFKLILI